MTLLSDNGIMSAILKGELSIEPFSEGSLTPNGYDLSIAELMLPDGGDVRREGALFIPPMSRVAISTAEVLSLGSGIAAQLWLRTRWARRGLLASFGKVDAGFRGTITIGALHCGQEPLKLVVGERVCQVCFERMDADAEGDYSTRSGTWQGQRGITLEPPPRRGDTEGP